MRTGVAIVIAASLVQAAPALGQPKAPANPTSTSGSEVGIKPADVENFARATIKLHILDQPTPEQMAETISSSGLTVDLYNQIAAKMAGDQGFKQRVDAELVRLQTTQQTTANVSATPLPPLPTSGLAARVLSVVGKVCMPMVREDVAVADVAPTLGLKGNRRDGSFRGELGERSSSVTIFPRGANQAVCNVELRYPIGFGEEISRALNIWTMHQAPELKMVRNDVTVGADGLKRTTLTWERMADGSASALVFVRVQNADGSPIEKGVSSATLLYSERPA